MTDLTPEPILQIASGFLAAKHLFVAAEIGLFEKLAKGAADARPYAGPGLKALVLCKLPRVR